MNTTVILNVCILYMKDKIKQEFISQPVQLAIVSTLVKPISVYVIMNTLDHSNKKNIINLGKLYFGINAQPSRNR